MLPKFFQIPALYYVIVKTILTLFYLMGDEGRKDRKSYFISLIFSKLKVILCLVH